MDVAQAFLDHVYKLRRFPKSIVSDRDKFFISTFWTKLLTICGIEQLLSTSNHPHTDGQTEVLNGWLESYLRCMTTFMPHQWLKWLPLAEYWYNTTYHSTTKLTPFEALYGQPPPLHIPYIPFESKVDSVDRSLSQRESTIQLLKQHLAKAQNRMKQSADKRRTD